MRDARLQVGLGLMLVAFGCQGPGVSRDEIPEAPIAFIFHSEDAARRRAEARQQTVTSSTPGEASAVVHLNTFRDYLEATLGRRAIERHAGRLSLLHPRSGVVTDFQSARAGAIPLDWSPNRDRLLSAQWELGRLQLFEFELASGAVFQLTGGSDHHPQGCYGSGGRLIAVVAKRPGLTEEGAGRIGLISRIAVLNPSGTAELLSPGPADGDPACNPDGTSVAYVRRFSDGRSEIWVRTLANEESARAIAEGRDPSFSPDGGWIVYSRGAGATPALWRIRPDGTGRTRLGVGSGSGEFGPAVSPDGALVVYESVSRSRHRLFVRRFDGSGDTVLFSDGDGTHAVW